MTDRTESARGRGWIVHKFGGSSVADAECFARVAGIIEAEREPGSTVSSDEQILADFRRRSGSVFHACGTCAMGSDPRTSVLDPRLRVRGVTALRVVDAAAFPNVTSGNTNAPVMMLAEKAAE